MMVIDDEAYYFIYSQHLAGGYIDHGPVIAFLIRGFTLMFGENGFGIRIGGVVLLTGLGVILYYFGKRYFSATTGVVFASTVFANILLHTNGIVITPDAPLVFFNILTIIFYYRAYFDDKKYYYIAGVFLGFALLTKISALFLAMGIILFPLVSRKRREFLSEKRFYLSLLIAFLIFLPFVIWNIRNDFAFIRYQGAHITRGGDLTSFIELWSALALLMGPILFYYSIYLPVKHIYHYWKKSNNDSKLLYFSLVTAVPVLYFAIHSLFSRFEVNWPAPALFGGLFIFGIYVSNHWKTKKRLFRLQIIYSLVLILLVTFQTYYPFLPLKGKSDITRRYHIYNCFPHDLKDYLESNPTTQKYRIVANNFQIPSMVNLYIRPVQEATCLSIKYHESLFSFLHPDESLVGGDYLFIGNSIRFPEKIKPYFREVNFLRSFDSVRNGKTIKQFGLWLVKGYRGKSNVTS